MKNLRNYQRSSTHNKGLADKLASGCEKSDGGQIVACHRGAYV